MNKLKRFRENLNKSPKEMASEMGISKSLYYKVESGLREPSYCFLKKFIEAFRASVDEVFF